MENSEKFKTSYFILYFSIAQGIFFLRLFMESMQDVVYVMSDHNIRIKEDWFATLNIFK